MADPPLVAVLAGGASRRMGTDKAMVEIAGRPMLAWVLAAAGRMGEVVVIGRDRAAAGAVAIPDDITPGHGPAAGLATALRVADGRAVLLLAADQPWVLTETLRHLWDAFDGERAMVPVDGGRPQTTCALYPASMRGDARRAAEEERSIRSIITRAEGIDEATWRSWGEDGRSWWSVDTPEDLAEGTRRFGDPGT